ncbi:hypothetical protein K491DRAFT_723047 [Lophiostoma macrostomum CBS 122681]|uniref:DUF7728 domain-containing protein n=1 Tax=Lophiostoma macrostomum CBS 122681 TaxID=1314788 RepID=A0A6A6SKC7_9PLEO|nr:hypothetical protein K491DRAFT_723047 [Lophiostoma macrostomum CBS 122681]
MLTQTGVYATLALAASAVLIPPHMATDDLGDDRALETLAIDPFKRTVALECGECASASAEGNKLEWEQNVGTTYLLDFEVGPGEDTLNIDGAQLYPPTFDHFNEPFYITQVDPHRTSEDALRLRVTGFTFQYNSAETITEAGTELLPMTFRITSIESTSINPPALTINLLKESTGRLMIASFETTKAGNESPIEQEKECKEWPLFCKWKSILADKLNSVKGSMGKGCHKGHKNPMAEETTVGKPPHRFRPGGNQGTKNNHHGHHHHHHGHHRFHMFLRRAFFTILIPILIGICAGTLTYLIGMAIGFLIAIVLAKVRGRGPYERIALEDEEDQDGFDGAKPSSEKEVYAELPQYEAPPVYEEAAEKEVVNETV